MELRARLYPSFVNISYMCVSMGVGVGECGWMRVLVQVCGCETGVGVGICGRVVFLEGEQTG